MALILEKLTFPFQYGNALLQSGPTKNPTALRLGVISTANINAAAGMYLHCTNLKADWPLTFRSVIHPVETHPDVILYAIGSRSYESAHEYAQKYKFAKAYGSYQEVLDDEAVDIVYVSTPNGMHFEWAAKAMEKGKHVLCEKPFTANGAEARKLLEIASRKHVLLLEAVCVHLPARGECM